MVLTYVVLPSIRKEAIQWTNIAFMAVCRVINGAATSLGRVPIVLDIYAERDLGSWYIY